MARRVRLKARWRLVRASVKSALWVLAGAVVLVLVVLQTGLGHRAALRWALGQAGARVAGQIEVDEIRSSSLLRGARLVGVRLREPGGELLFSADSVEVSYRLFSLVRGDLVLAGLELWGPHLRLVRGPGDDVGTLRRWLGPPGPEGGGAGGGTQVLFDGVRIWDGRVDYRDPLASGADTTGVLRWANEGDGVVRAFEAHGVTGRLERLAIGPPDASVVAEIVSLDAVLDVLREPIRLAGVGGNVRLVGDTLRLDDLDGEVDASAVEGNVALALPGDQRPLELTVDLAIDRLALARYEWLIGAVPPLAGSAVVAGRIAESGQRWRITALDATLEGGRVTGSGAIELDGQMRLDGVDLRVSDLPLGAMAPYLPGDTLPTGLAGRLTGDLQASGPIRAPTGNGSFRLARTDEEPLVGTFRGGLLVPAGGELGARDLVLVFERFDWGLATAFAPALRLYGPGEARIAVTGDLADGLRFDAELRHAPAEAPESHVLASGSVRRMGENDFALDIQGDLSPLSLTALRLERPEFPLEGEIAGAFRARGLLSDLEVRAEVETGSGSLDLVARGDVRAPAEGYAIEGTIEAFEASRYLAALPDPSTFSGYLRVAGRGLTPSEMNADATFDLTRSWVAGLAVDTVHLEAHVRGGQMTLDTLTARAAGFSLEAGGTLAVDSVQPAGEVRVAFETASLLGIRPLFMGDTVIAADTLGALELELLRLSGVEPDTLPVLADVEMDGSARGAFVLTGNVRDFRAVGTLELDDVRYGRTTLASASANVDVGGLPGRAGRLVVDLETGPAELFGRSFSGGRAELTYTRPEGSAELELRRSDAEDYRARADFELDSLGGRLQLEELALRFDTLNYALTGPASLQWDDSALVVRDFEVSRPGPDPLSIAADGRLPRRGRADFDLRGRGVRLERLTQLAQREDLDLAGRLDIDLSVEGTAADPVIMGSFSGSDITARTATVSAVEGELAYRNRSADLQLDAWRDDLRILELEGTVPIDLALRSVADRTGISGLDLDLRVDSLPAVFVLALLEDLEDVHGTVSGDLRIGGSVDDPEPTGTLRLRGGAWTVGALGVRQSQVEADLDVAADGVVDVRASGRAGGGTVDVDGTVTLAPVADPGLDLRVRLNRFRGVDRRDVEGTVSGEVQFGQRFRRPVITGDLRVDEGVLHLEEFQRSAGVVDLSDPRFFTYVDTSLLRGRPLLAETRNPFMDSLRVNVDLSVQRGTWLRSPQMNVEIGGNLIVTYDRAAQDIVMIGELEAVRGQYSFYGRTFDVQDGTVEFIGTPGINPNLAIQAAARVRRREADPLVINANLSGTLVDPRVRLSTETGTIPESDLISYLIFGRPSSEVNALIAGGGGGGGAGEIFGEGVSIATSTLVSSLASLAQGVGWFDYLSVSQAADVSASSGGLSPFASTQLEVGQYFLGGDYFAAVTLRPLSGTGSSSGNILGGFRLEWQASDQYHLEAFAEDRFLRGGGFGFQELGIRSSLIYGFSFFREWGY